MMSSSGNDIFWSMKQEQRFWLLNRRRLRAEEPFIHDLGLGSDGGVKSVCLSVPARSSLA